jgi:2-oxoglutarate ferredoxin oxidoreductase subunit gamma
MPENDTIDEVAVRICGVGGQGVVLAANILAESLAQKFAHATTSSAYGPEVRGTSVRADVCASTRWIDYPRVDRPALVLALAQKEYDLAVKDAADDALILYDPSTIEPVQKDGVRQIPVDASQMSQDNFGRPANANLIMLGAAAAYLAEIDFDALSRTVRDKISDREAAARALEIGRSVKDT